ncbi:MAG: F0F1 ATP synthase subunit delta [Bacteroidales bacterium]|nr:F0F1 ATP synthase subunit delta [Bacteroidales bacterium]MCM1147371.1 F0F1 ATP synthase subunit delta [Bacteroidales bacterium]MCM1207194.1 F0F1 ATP synthase subunit delta [Bacillota bacterium]MCM1510427.1 F0F1 ATP synthase subunit delta [Clostridium sp.]
MDLGVISIRYARALHKSAVQMGCDDDVYSDMVTLTNAYMDVPQLRHTIDNPMLQQEKKESLLKSACGTNPAELTIRFLKLVLQEGRETVMQFIAQSYITLYRKQKNIVHGRLTTATAVSPATEQKVRKMVAQRTNGTVEFLTEINPDIIGGFILEYDTYRMDASVRSKLQGILKQLK